MGKCICTKQSHDHLYHSFNICVLPRSGNDMYKENLCQVRSRDTFHLTILYTFRLEIFPVLTFQMRAVHRLCLGFLFLPGRTLLAPRFVFPSADGALPWYAPV